MKYNMDELADQKFFGGGLPEGVEFDDFVFSVNGIVYAEEGYSKRPPMLKNGAKFVSGGFKDKRDVVFLPGTIIEIGPESK